VDQVAAIKVRHELYARWQNPVVELLDFRV